MQYLVINLVLIIIFIFYFQRLQKRQLSFLNTALNQLDISYQNLIKERKNIQDEIKALEGLLNEIVALYEVTKEVCKTLVEQELFSIFKEKLSRFLKFQDCLCVNSEEELKSKQDYSIFPLLLKNEAFGYLAIKGLNKDGEYLLPILINQFTMCLRRVRLYQKVQELAITDNLTAVYSRRYCSERLAEEIKRSLEFKFKFSILMIDIDHFKKYNDLFGHLVGDVILRQVATVIKDNIRSIDLLGRFGGEEFIVILPQTSKEVTSVAAERIREAVKDSTIKAYDEALKVTISIGSSTFPDDSKELTDLIDKADFSLYRAKKTGRNRVSLYGVYE